MNTGKALNWLASFWVLVNMTAYHIVLVKAEKSDKFIRVFVIFP